MKKFKSIANEIVKGPVILVVIVILTTIASSIYALWNMENQVIYNMEHTIVSSASQLEYSLNEIEQRYIDYWLTDDSYRNIKYYTLDTDKSKYVSEFSKTKGWITNIQSLHPEVQGVCAYFANVDLMVFSDNTEKYLMKFQSAEKLSVDGIYGKKSYAKAMEVKR